MSEETSRVMIVRPFGPFVGKFFLPDTLVDDINRHIDKSLDDTEVIKNLDWSQNLVGKVHQELKIPDDILEPHETFFKFRVHDYLQQILTHSVVSLNTANCEIQRREAWVVRSFSGDFNPAHVHSDASICIAGFLKIPDWHAEIAEDALDHAPSRGKLCFMHGNTQEWGNNLMFAEPKVGECYIFPSTLTHFVYPFKTKGERRSFSINFSKIFSHVPRRPADVQR